MSIWYPIFPLRRFPAMIRITALSAVMAGCYGMLHDQISYTISPEYFTKLKFHQFAWADIGLPPRIFVAVIGFLATWWVGLIGGWLLSRLGLAELSEIGPWKYFFRAFAIVLGIAAMCGAIGVFLGFMASQADLTSWKRWQDHLGLEDLRGFIIVAYLHWASYLGGLLGVIGAVVYVKRTGKRMKDELISPP